MSLGDISFIAAFVVFPLVIVALSVWALRTLSRRERRPLAQFSSDSPAESTQELPFAELEEPQDWAAAVHPTRDPAANEESEVAATPTQSFKVPTYRGRSKGIVRRLTFQSRPVPRSPESGAINQSESE